MSGSPPVGMKPRKSGVKVSTMLIGPPTEPPPEGSLKLNWIVKSAPKWLLNTATRSMLFVQERVPIFAVKSVLPEMLWPVKDTLLNPPMESPY